MKLSPPNKMKKTSLSWIQSTNTFLVSCRQYLARVVPRAEPVERAEVGDIASVHYIGTLDNGEMFDTSRQEGRVPLEFEIGYGNVIAGFDKVVTGLAVGETNKLRVIPSDAYGDYSDELMMTFPKSVRKSCLYPLSVAIVDRRL